MSGIAQQRQHPIGGFPLAAIGGADPGIVEVLLAAQLKRPGSALGINYRCRTIRFNLSYYHGLTIADIGLPVVAGPPQFVANGNRDRLSCKN